MGVLREIERAERRAIREQEKKQREINRQKAIERRAYEKQLKIDYLNCQQEKANLMTKQIVEQYEKYKKIGNIILPIPRFFYFENYKKKYVASTFQYNKPVPVKQENSKSIKVPKESKIEHYFSFLKNRRLAIEAKRKTLEEQELDEYNLNLKKYEEDKQNAINQFEKQEQYKKEEIENFNNSIEEWKNGCKSYNQKSLDKYFNELLNFFYNKIGNIIISKTKYDLNDGVLIYEMFLKKEYELFSCEGYKFYKQEDTIKPIMIKRNTVSTILKELIPNLAICFLDLLYKNDELNLFNEIIVNVYYERKCCSSIKLNREVYKGLNLMNEDNFYYVYDHYMRNYKVISTGVKPFDSVYIDLV